MSQITIRQVRDLPADIKDLTIDARLGGYGSIDRLVSEWADARNRFDRAGEHFLAADVNDRLAGVGGLTVEPTDTSILRMRRLYVRTEMRRHGVGRRIVEALLDHARRHTGVVTVNAGTSEAAAFWLRMGFSPHGGGRYTRIFVFA